jgi:hypothetical protein
MKPLPISSMIWHIRLEAGLDKFGKKAWYYRGHGITHHV